MLGKILKLSIKNKIIQLINKISHRSEQTDDETSVRQESKQKRLLWCFIGIILLIGGYFWWRMPARMRVVAVIPREINDRVGYTPLGLYCLSQPSLSRNYPVLILYGWDGKECWSNKLPENNISPKVNNWELACSPDGHYVAVSVIEKNKIHVMSWRDGKSVSDSYLDYENKFKLNTQSIYLEITTSGKIWVYYNNSKDFTLKIIDGIKIASCKLPFDNYNRYFSPENDTIVNLTKNGIYVVSSINIKNTKILPTIVASKRLSSYSVELSKIIFHDDKNNMYIQNGKGFIKTTYKTDGYAIIRGTNNNLLVFREHDAVNENNRHLLNIKTMKEWNIPVKQNLTKVLYGTQDGKHVLLCESNYHKELEHLYLFLLKYLKLNQNQEYKYQKIINDYNEKTTKYTLSILNNYNETEAIFPFIEGDNLYGKYNYSGFNYSGKKFVFSNRNPFCISPDGRSLYINCFIADEKKRCSVILGR